MPVVSGDRRVIFGGIAIASTALAAYALYNRKKVKAAPRLANLRYEFEEVNEIESKSKSSSEMPIERGGRRNYRRDSPREQPSSPEKTVSSSSPQKSESPQSPQKEAKVSVSWSDVVQNQEAAERLAAEFAAHCETVDSKTKMVEEEGGGDVQVVNGTNSEEEELQRVMGMLNQNMASNSSKVSPYRGGSGATVPTCGKHHRQTAESPFSATSDVHSETSQDSGRGGSTGVANSMSPVEETDEIGLPPIYEFEIPKSIVGLIIGKKGVVIKDLTNKSGTFILIRDHHLKEDYKICTIEGTREQINNCLRMIRRRFPPSRYPELNLNPVLPPPIASPTCNLWGTGLVQLTLPDGVPCETVLSCIVDAGHIFLQQPTHPSFTSLTKLDQYMLAVYSQPAGVPPLPKPAEIGVVCAAPSLGGWFRALTAARYDESDEVLVKFVDYGGYSRLPASDLRQIRSDFMALPFQATECYLAHLEPMDVDEGWTPEASAVLEELTRGKVIEAQVASYAPDGVPLVELYANGENGDVIDINRILVDEGYARWAEEEKNGN